jgi:hypothetical protein
MTDIAPEVRLALATGLFVGLHKEEVAVILAFFILESKPNICTAQIREALSPGAGRTPWILSPFQRLGNAFRYGFVGPVNTAYETAKVVQIC